MANEILKDDELGDVEIRYRIGARRFTLRCVMGKVILTLPNMRSRELGIAFLNEHRDYCKKILQQPKHLQAKGFFDENTEWKSLTFRLKMEPSDMPKIRYNLKDGILYLYYPKNTNVDTEKFQSTVKKVLSNFLLYEAKSFLPKRLKLLADQHGFEYKSCTIRNNSSRWGSCSSSKSINLTLYLMKLPIELIDYVLLHELCHLREMNHGPKFWELLNSLTDGKAKQLRDELKNYAPCV